MEGHLNGVVKRVLFDRGLVVIQQNLNYLAHVSNVYVPNSHICLLEPGTPVLFRIENGYAVEVSIDADWIEDERATPNRDEVGRIIKQAGSHYWIQRPCSCLLFMPPREGFSVGDHVQFRVEQERTGRFRAINIQIQN